MMTYVCATKVLIADIPNDVVFAVTVGNQKAMSTDVRIIGSFDSGYLAIPEAEREMLIECLVVAADLFRSKLTELIRQRHDRNASQA